MARLGKGTIQAASLWEGPSGDSAASSLEAGAQQVWMRDAPGAITLQKRMEGGGPQEDLHLELSRRPSTRANPGGAWGTLW